MAPVSSSFSERLRTKTSATVQCDRVAQPPADRVDDRDAGREHVLGESIEVREVDIVQVPRPTVRGGSRG
jgi:hypothetical protein